MSGTDSPAGSTPKLQVLNPDATAEEVAAVVAVFSALGSADAPEPPKRRSLWASPAHRVRTPLHPGPGAWRASGLPH